MAAYGSNANYPRFSTLVIGIVSILAFLAAGISIENLNHSLLLAPRLHRFVLGDNPTNSCSCALAQSDFPRAIRSVVVSRPALGDNDDNLRQNNGLEPLAMRTGKDGSGMMADYWYCDQTPDLPWPELDLNWCLANWHDGLLIAPDIRHFGHTEHHTDLHERHTYKKDAGLGSSFAMLPLCSRLMLSSWVGLFALTFAMA